jgi:hypothetical protein
MVLKYTNILFFKALQNIPKLDFFGLKIYHLATLATAIKNRKWILSFVGASLRWQNIYAQSKQTGM